MELQSKLAHSSFTERSDDCTRSVASDIKNAPITPREKLAEIPKLILRYAASCDDMSSPVWGKVDQHIKPTADRTRAERKALVREILHECGFRGEDLETRTLLYVAFIGWGSFASGLKKENVLPDNLEEILDIILRPEDQPGLP